MANSEQLGLTKRPDLISRLPVALNEDDELSPDPNVVRLFWLQKASEEINGVLSKTLPELGQFTARFKSISLKAFDPNDRVLPEYFPSFQRNQVKACIESAQRIAETRGFRFGPSLLTAGEHAENGSSGYGDYAKIDPDIPILLLEEKNTPEDIDKARRLGGMTRLNLSTGRVTNEIDQEAKANPNFFLPTNEIERIQTLEGVLQHEIEEAVPKAIAEHQKTPRLLVNLERYMFGEMTTPEIDARYSIALARYSGRNSFSIWDCIKAGKKIAFATGCWDFILTPQEILLRTKAEVDERYKNRPYTPLSIQDGAPLSEVVHLRRGERCMTVASGILGSGLEMPFTFRLEDLGDNAETIKSPTMVQRNDHAVSAEDDSFRGYYADKIQFPFARPQDWYYKD